MFERRSSYAEYSVGKNKMKLELTNRIVRNETYKKELDTLRSLEMGRVFCKHDMEHFLSVARLTLILCGEKNISVQPDMIYSAALLHDIGRTEQYKNGTPHDIAGEQIAERILNEVGCPDDMRINILSLIASHRNKDNKKDSLEDIFYIADKRSRLCFCCEAQDECNWSLEKRNMEVEF